MVAILLPFAVLPFDFGFKVSLFNVAVCLVLVRWAAAGLQAKLQPVHVSSLAPILLFALLYTASAFWGFNFGSPTFFEIRKATEYLLGMMLFPVALTTLKTFQHIRVVAIMLAVCGAISALIALFLYFVPNSVAITILGSLTVFEYPEGSVALRFIGDNPLQPMRAIGLTIDPNLLGAVLVLSIAVLLPLLFQSPTPSVQIASGFALSVIVAAVYLTYSRNALVAIGTIGLFLALFRYRLLLPIGAGLALALGLLPQTQAYVLRLADGFLGRDLATQMRYNEYANALEIIRQWPWTGVGLFGTPGVDLERGVSMVYLAIATSMGIPSLVLFCGILFAPLLMFVKARWRNHPDEVWLLGLVGAIIGLVMTGLFDHFYFNLLYPHMSALFWLLLGTCVAALRLVISNRNLESTT